MKLPLRILLVASLATAAAPAAVAQAADDRKPWPRACKAAERDAERSEPRLTQEQRDAILAACTAYSDRVGEIRLTLAEARTARRETFKAAVAELRAACPKQEGETRRERRERCAEAIAAFRQAIRDARAQFRTARRTARADKRAARREFRAAVRAALGR